MEGFIYILIDPITGKIRYVGQTDDPNKRLKCHWRDRLQKKNLRNHKAHWIAKLWQDYRVKPSMDIIETLNAESMEELESILNERELYWINHYLDRGCDLTNTSHKFYNRIINHHRVVEIKNAKKLFVYTRDGDKFEFQSNREAARQLNIHYKNIHKALKRKSLVGGYVVSLTELNGADINAIFDKSIYSGRIIILDISSRTWEIHENQSTAAQSRGMTFREINYLLRFTVANRELGRFNRKYANLRAFYGSDETVVRDYLNRL